MKRSLTLLVSAVLFTIGASAQTTNSSPYCMPQFDPMNNVGSAVNYIDKVNLFGGAFSNTSTLYMGSSYVYYNNLSTIPVSAIPFTSGLELGMGGGTPTSSGSAYCEVYIDCNHNNVFDSVENVSHTYIPGVGMNMYAGLILPETARYGNTRMRIQWIRSINTVGPCQSAPSDAYGEVEDYNVTIIDTYPIVATTSVSNLTNTSARLNGLVNANFSTASVDSFEYGLTTSYGTTVATNSVWSLTDSAVSKSISGLTPATTYHYRIKGTNINGTAYGNDVAFTTNAGVGISIQKAGLQVKIYPNPANDILHIDNLEQTAIYSIQDIAGATIKKGALQAGNNTLSITALPSGIYILEVYNEHGEKNIIKLVK